jgi:hypothetical protein
MTVRIKQHRQRGAAMPSDLGQSQTPAWVTCPKGSCHRHQACMYVPCRRVKVRDEQLTREVEQLRMAIRAARECLEDNDGAGAALILKHCGVQPAEGRL